MILARYPPDLADTKWAVLAPLIPAAKAGGRLSNRLPTPQIFGRRGR